MQFDSFNQGGSDYVERHYKHNVVMIKSKFCNWEIQNDDGKKYVRFNIKIFNVLFNYQIYRWYSDFVKLNEELIKKFQHIKWPALPSKIFFLNYDPIKLNQRMLQLENYLNKILEIFSRNDDLFTITEFINLHNNNVHSLLDLNQSNVQVMDPVTISYIKLIYEPKAKTT